MFLSVLFQILLLLYKNEQRRIERKTTSPSSPGLILTFNYVRKILLLLLGNTLYIINFLLFIGFGSILCTFAHISLPPFYLGLLLLGICEADGNYLSIIRFSLKFMMTVSLFNNSETKTTFNKQKFNYSCW